METTGSMTVRAAREADFPACAQLWIEMFEEVGNFSESDFLPDWRERFVAYATERAACDELYYAVAECDGEIVGAAGALIRDGYPSVVHGVRFGYIFGVSVRPAARKRGLATALTQECVAWLQQRNVRRIYLHASRFGRPIYEKMGFIPSNEMLFPL